MYYTIQAVNNKAQVYAQVDLHLCCSHRYKSGFFHDVAQLYKRIIKQPVYKGVAESSDAVYV